MATDYSGYQNPLNGLLTGLLGGEVDTTTKEEQIGHTGTLESGTSTVADNRTENRTGTTTTTGTGTSTGTTTARSLADISRLEDVYRRQAAGVTPEMLAAIFSEGQRKVPGLTGAYANAVGARSSGNTPLGVALRDLNADLTNKAAVLNNELLSGASDTAGKIADLTKTMQTEESESSTKNDVVSQILSTIMGGGTTTTSNRDTDVSSDLRVGKDVEQRNTLNTDVLKILALLGGGTSILGGAGVDISKILPAIGGVVKDTGALDWLTDLLGDDSGDVFDVGINSGAVDLGEWLDIGWADGGRIPRFDKKLQKRYGSIGAYQRGKGYADGGEVGEAAAGEKKKEKSASKRVNLTPEQQMKLNEMLMNPQLRPYALKVLMQLGMKDQMAAGETAGGGIGGMNTGTVGTPSSNAAAIGTMGEAALGLGLSAMGPVGAAIGIGLSAANAMGLTGIAPHGVMGTMAGLAQAGMAAQAEADASTLGVGLATDVGLDEAGFSAAIGESTGVAEGISAAEGAGMGGDSGAGDGGNSGPGGGSDAGDGGDGPGGWTDGGKLPKQVNDPQGIKDTMQVPVSGGEFMIPTDVVDMLGEEFFQNLIMRYHTPVQVQKAMSGFMPAVLRQRDMGGKTTEKGGAKKETREEAAKAEGKAIKGPNDTTGVPLQMNMQEAFPLLMQQLLQDQLAPANRQPIQVRGMI